MSDDRQTEPISSHGHVERRFGQSTPQQHVSASRSALQGGNDFHPSGMNLVQRHQLTLQALGSINPAITEPVEVQVADCSKLRTLIMCCSVIVFLSRPISTGLLQEPLNRLLAACLHQQDKSSKACQQITAVENQLFIICTSTNLNPVAVTCNKSQMNWLVKRLRKEKVILIIIGHGHLLMVEIAMPLDHNLHFSQAEIFLWIFSSASQGCDSWDTVLSAYFFCKNGDRTPAVEEPMLFQISYTDFPIMSASVSPPVWIKFLT